MRLIKVEAWTPKPWAEMDDRVDIGLIGHKGRDTLSLLTMRSFQFSSAGSNTIVLWAGAVELDKVVVSITDADSSYWNIRATTDDGRQFDLNIPRQTQNDETQDFTIALRKFPWKLLGIGGAVVAGYWLVKPRGR